MEEPLTLKLIIEKGPREGETLEFHPRSTVRIGRIARGNTFAVKDAGVSSKHLSIEFSPAAAAWLLQDLDSSNGTFLNGAEIPPFSPSALRDGDTVKIGEVTSILVKIVDSSSGDGGGDPDLPVLRKNPRRRAAAKAAEVLETGAAGRDRRRGARASKEENPEAKDRNLGLDRENGHVGVGVGSENVAASVAEKPVRRGRPPRKARVLKTEREQEEASEVQQVVEVGNVIPVEEKQRMSTRRTRNSTTEQQPVALEPEATSFNQDIGKEVPASAPAEGRKLRASTRQRKNLEDEPVANKVKIDDLNGKENVELNVGQETGVEAASTSGAKDGSSRVEDVAASDLEKMTLGEWFDHLEVALPRQIRAETEKMIEAMKLRAEQVSEFVAMKNENGNVPIS